MDVLLEVLSNVCTRCSSSTDPELVCSKLGTANRQTYTTVQLGDIACTHAGPSSRRIFALELVLDAEAAGRLSPVASNLTAATGRAACFPLA